jgi:PTS system mannitol-specific IIA component
MALSRSELRALLPPECIDLSAWAIDRDDAIRRSGAMLVAAGAVDPGYVEQMIERERTVSTFVGSGIAMPHGTLSAKNDVLNEGLALLLLAEPVDWGGHPVTLVIAIAAHGRRYITLLSQLAAVLLDDGRADELRAATTAERVRELLTE